MLRAQSLVVPGRLEGVSVDLPPDRVTAIVGPNGAGKSTLLSALAGLIAGDVAVDDRRLDAMPPRERALAGALLVLVTDSACRVWPLTGGDLRLGIALSLIGAPFFLMLLMRLRRDMA